MGIFRSPLSLMSWVSRGRGVSAIVGWERANTAENSHTQSYPQPIGPQARTSQA